MTSDKSNWYSDEFETHDDFIRDFEKKSQAFRDIVLSDDEKYKTVTTPDDTVFALDKKSGFLYIFHNQCTYDYLCKEDVIALAELLQGMKKT